MYHGYRERDIEKQSAQSQLLRGCMKGLFTTAGILSLALGSAGIIIPGLPTTPFVLLAAYFFVRSSPRLHAWLISHPRFGSLIVRFQEGKGLPLRLKIFALATAYGFVSISIIILDVLFLRILLILLILTATVYMMRIPTYRRDSIEASSADSCSK